MPLSPWQIITPPADWVARELVVLTLQTDTLAGLLVVSHEQGEVRVYQFSTSSQEVDCMELDGRHKPSELKRQQPPGFQCILQCTQHSAAVGAIAIASRVSLLAFGDAEGWLSVVDLAQVGRCSVTMLLSSLQCPNVCLHAPAAAGARALRMHLQSGCLTALTCCSS